MDELGAKKPGRRQAGWHEWGLCALAVFPALPKRPNSLQKTCWSPASFVPFLASRWLLSLGEVHRVGLKSEPTCGSLSVYINPQQNLHTHTHMHEHTHSKRLLCNEIQGWLIRQAPALWGGFELALIDRRNLLCCLQPQHLPYTISSAPNIPLRTQHGVGEEAERGLLQTRSCRGSYLWPKF